MITFLNNSGEIEAFIYGKESLFLVKRTPQEIMSKITSISKYAWTRKLNAKGSSLPETFREAISDTHSVVMIREGKVKIFGNGVSFCVATHIQPEYLNEKFKQETAVA